MKLKLLTLILLALPILCEAQRKHHKPTRSHELTIGADNGIIIPHGDSAFFWDQHSHQLSINDTSSHALSFSDFKYQPQFYVWQENDITLLRVTGIDSTGTTTVTFAKSRVHFLNDSTFTFKMKFK